jgi:4-amino-4-deoxy-L-arabinose transferase-like glycosyltransferase
VTVGPPVSEEAVAAWRRLRRWRPPLFPAGDKDGPGDSYPARADVGILGFTSPPRMTATATSFPARLADAHPQASELLAGRSMPDATPLSEAASRVDHRQASLPHGTGHRPGRRRLTAAPWPLLIVLVVQAGLSLRLVWSDTAFQDEALYLRAGHLEWARWLHQVPVPNFPAYFSGAPVIYPPIGALADSIGGLAAARILSLCFMLGVTTLLWATTARLYGRRAALLAAGLFATLAGTQLLGSFATYDAMALFLLAMATWLGVQSAGRQTRVRTLLLVTTGFTLAAADAVKYATVLFTPVVLAIVAFAVWRQQRGAPTLTASMAVLSSWLTLVVATILAGGREYWHGIATSTLARPQSSVPVATIFQRAYVWTSLILVLAALGAVLASRSERQGKLLPSILAVAGLLVPAGQARLHTTVSLQKHVVFGAWFAAIAAGYAMARLSRVDPGHGWAAVMALPIAASTLFGSMGQAASLHAAWPNSASLTALLRLEIHIHQGNYLAEGYDVEAYYLRADVPWQRWSSTYFLSYPGTRSGAASYEAAIAKHYFSLVILDFGDTPATDRQITADMRHAGGYYILARTGQFTIWASSRQATPSQQPRRTRAGY